MCALKAHAFSYHTQSKGLVSSILQPSHPPKDSELSRAKIALYSFLCLSGKGTVHFSYDSE